MSRVSVNNDYFDWMYDLVCKGRYAKNNSYRELLLYLHDVEFTYLIRGDSDRALDGVSLRHRFALLDRDHYDYITDRLDGPCSVLEMLIALAIRCEETIMTDPAIGDRTGQWFWKMIVNLGLGGMIDSRFDRRYVGDMVDKFLDRKYDSDGRGGLFVVRKCNYDLRNIDIWTQMMWYLDTML